LIIGRTNRSSSKTKSAFGKKIAAVLEPPADPALGAGAEEVKGMGDAAISWMGPLRRNGHKLLCISLLFGMLQRLLCTLRLW